MLKYLAAPRYFNSQPHKEADASPTPITDAALNFNSQPHKEADGGLMAYAMNWWIFQLTASQGG